MLLAYLDPATGGVVIQTLIAAAVAVPFILRAQISRGVQMLRGIKQRPEPIKDDQKLDD